MWYWLFRKALRGSQQALRQGSNGWCANRAWTKLDINGKIEITVTWRDLRKPDAYSREELVKMLREVRKHEAIQHWKTPDPSLPHT